MDPTSGLHFSKAFDGRGAKQQEASLAWHHPDHFGRYFTLRGSCGLGRTGCRVLCGPSPENLANRSHFRPVPAELYAAFRTLARLPETPRSSGSNFSPSVIYIGGFSLTLAPAKAGEAIRSFYLKSHGVSYGDSLAAFLMERIMDVLAVLLIAGLAAWIATGIGQAHCNPSDRRPGGSGLPKTSLLSRARRINAVPRGFEKAVRKTVWPFLRNQGLDARTTAVVGLAIGCDRVGC